MSNSTIHSGQTPEEVVLQLIREMYEWELWANKAPEHKFGSTASGRAVSMLDQIEEKYNDIVSRYALDQSASHGMSYGDPTRYDKDEQVISSSVAGDKAIVITRQQHQVKLFEEMDDPNYTVHFTLKRVNGNWRVVSRKVEDFEGEIFDVGI